MAETPPRRATGTDPSPDGSAFPLLFSPFTIRHVTLANRVVLLPMGLRFTTDGTVEDRAIAFYEARARAGVGLVITGGTVVHPTSVMRQRVLLEGFRRDNIPGFAALAHAVHSHGSKLFGQLFHVGREVAGDSEWPLWAPSAVASPNSTKTPHAMTTGEMADVMEGFAHSASNLMEGGYDGIELHAAHGYLLGEFLSPHANRRDDGYGGDVETRVRFPLEVAGAVRDHCGADTLVGIRISANEELEGGLRLPEAIETAKALTRNGAIDYISVALGRRGGYVKDMTHPTGLAVADAAAIRRATAVPVMASQRITHPPLAEEILATGAADLVGMARAHIADPQWTRWAREGALDRILPCVGCLQECRTRVDGVGCVHNPVTGRERQLGAPTAATTSRTVVVVGGGPAGLEAARIAGERGHSVILYEGEAELGGQVRLAARAPHRAEIDGVIDFRKSELARLGVEIRLSTRATTHEVLEDAPDSIIVATGVQQDSPIFPIAADAKILTVYDLLRGGTEVPPIRDGATSAVVIDDGAGSWECFSSAEALIDAGLAVTLVTPAKEMAPGIPAESFGPLMTRLHRRKFRLLVGTGVASVDRGSVSIYNPHRLHARRVLEEETIQADVAVLCGPTRGDDRLYRELLDIFPDVRAVGDCVTPRRIFHAVLEGHRAALAIR